MVKAPSDWGEASERFDEITAQVSNKDLSSANEAQTRFDVIDRLVKEVLGWRYGQISVEEPSEGARHGYVDYILRSGDHVIVVEAKKFGAAFPTPTRKRQLKLSGSVLGSGDTASAICQVDQYANAKQADVAIATNGFCWIYYAVRSRDEESYATLLFPFHNQADARALFESFAEAQVEKGSLERVTNTLPRIEDRLLSVLHDADGRVDRNNIADHILPALNSALYADALLSSPVHLERCFVSTEARTKFDNTLGMYLADPKPPTVKPARRIRKSKDHSQLERILERSASSFAPPVTLIIGPVGAGKSTYLKHFELISGRDVLNRHRVHWIYIDFEEMGPEGDPRKFLYGKLRDYLLAEHPDNPTDYRNAVEPAYEEEIKGLASGPWAPIFTNKEEFNKRLAEYLAREYEAVEPYVDKIFRHLASKRLCVVVLDNIDLYEDDKLETTVFAEGLALSKRIFANIIVSVRDKTFVRHRTDSAFDAYELRKLWLDPPPFKEVLSARLTYSKKILEGKSARVDLANGMHLAIPDLSVFFEIVQRSVLRGSAGDYIDSVADLNIRRGLTLITNFLTSGHIQADRALKAYIVEGNRRYLFPFHEVYKGTMLAQWRRYKEERSECVNLFDARLGAKSLRLIRLWLLNHLLTKAQYEHTVEVPVEDCIELFSAFGASENHVVGTLKHLYKHGLVRTVSAEELDAQSTVVATRSGGYYAKILCRKLVYAEEVMLDTAIEDPDAWQALSEDTYAIEAAGSVRERMNLRAERIQRFMSYLVSLESSVLETMAGAAHLRKMPEIMEEVVADADDAVRRSMRYYPK